MSKWKSYRVILKNGQDVYISCESLNLIKNDFGELIDIKAIGTINNFIYWINLSEIAAIVQVR